MEENEGGLVRLVGSVEHVIYANEDNGYTICDVGTESDELVTVTGILPYVGEGDSVTLYGRWVHNPKYGRQFRAESCERRLPADSASMLRYLSSGAI
jgi:exodeoxyribonuclease V alpha subunit